MYNTEGNKHRLCIRDNLLNCWQLHQHIHLKGKKQVLQCINSKYFLWKETSAYWKFKDKILRIKFKDTIFKLF